MLRAESGWRLRGIEPESCMADAPEDCGITLPSGRSQDMITNIFQNVTAAA